MTKKGPLGRAEKFYVKEHYTKSDTKEIAKELDRPIATIQKAIDEFELENPTKPPGSAGSQMARREGIVTMTSNASQASDAKRAKGKAKSRSSKCITTTTGDSE